VADLLTPTLLAAVRAAVAEAVRPTPALLDQPAAIVFTGLSRSGWFRLKATGKLPAPVHVEGSGERWRTKDLEDWIARMKPRRK
jgi:predicted DNA-binding transcriptional regulator AlpA